MSNLQFAKRGKLIQPRKFFIYGPAGLGKTSLAADSSNPIIIDIDEGSGNLDIVRYPFDESGRTQPKTYQEFMAAIDDLLQSPHDFKTVVIDTADKLEALMHRFMLARDSDSKNKARNESGGKLTSIEDYGWGKGYTLAVDEWRALLFKFDELRQKRSMNIIFIAHSQIKSFKNPEGADYDRYIAKIHEKAFGVIKEWCDVVGFLTLDTIATSQGVDDKRARGVSTGTRVLCTQPNATCEVKARGLSLRDRIEVPVVRPWSVFADAIAQSDGTTNESLVQQINALIASFEDEEYKTKATKLTESAFKEGNRDNLIKILGKLNERIKKEDTNV